MLQVGDIAPEFSLPNQNGVIVNLSDFRGQKVIVYFYPKDDTPSCTKEACSFRDNFDQYVQQNVVILGISFDNKKSHQQFIEKFDLPFQLLSDINTKVAAKYGVYGEKIMYGKKFMGIHRTTFIIDENGRVAHIFKNVKPTHHGKEVLKKL